MTRAAPGKAPGMERRGNDGRGATPRPKRPECGFEQGIRPRAVYSFGHGKAMHEKQR